MKKEKLKKFVKVKENKLVQGTLEVFDIEVKDAHHYILENGAVSHNSVGAYVPMQEMAGGCLVRGESIYTSNGIKNIEEVTTGDFVLSHDGAYHKVTHTFKFVKPCYHVTFEKGKEIQCSSNHKFLKIKENPMDINSWISADNLEPGEVVYYLSTREEILPIKVVENCFIGNRTVFDISVRETHTYVSNNRIINHNSGVKYNSSVTIELSVAKLEDKENEKAASEKVGSNTVKNGVLVTAKPMKSRFCIPQKVKFQIPYFKKPNPYVGLESFLTWENSGVCRGTCYTNKEKEKLSPSDQLKCLPFMFENEQMWCLPKDTARGVVVSHLGRSVSFTEFFSDIVFTEEFLKKINETVIKPLFELPSQSSFEDVKELEECLGIKDEENSEEKIEEKSEE